MYINGVKISSKIHNKILKTFKHITKFSKIPKKHSNNIKISETHSNSHSKSHSKIAQNNIINTILTLNINHSNHKLFQKYLFTMNQHYVFSTTIKKNRK